MTIAMTGSTVLPGAFIVRLVDDARAMLERYPDIAIRHVRAAVAMLRARTKSGRSAISYAKGGLAPWQVTKITRFVQSNLSDTLSTATMSAQILLSPGHFSRAFKLSLGLSPHAYITQQRVDAAKRMMRRSETPLAVIAVACGLTDQAHLCHLFRKHVGLTPSAWRSGLQREE